MSLELFSGPNAHRPAAASTRGATKTGPLLFALAFIAAAFGAAAGGCKVTVGNTGGTGGGGASSSGDSTTTTTTSTVGSTSSASTTTSTGTTLPLACMNVTEISDPGEADGDTTGLADGVQSNCEQAGAGEVAYHFVAKQTGILHVELDSVADLGLYARTDCGALSSEIACSDNEAAGAKETLDVDVLEGQSVYIFVDGYFSGEQGPFTIKARSAVPGCGDGIVFGDEECDPPDDVSCDGTCHLLPEDCNDGVDNDKDDLTDCEDTSCVGDPACDFTTFCNNATPLTATTTIGTTVGGSSNFSGSCTGLSTAEKVYVYNPTQSGVLALTLSSAADLGLHARSTCDVKTTEVGCADKVTQGVAEHLSLPVAPGHPLTIFVDGKDGHTGSFSLQSVLTPFTELEPNDSRPQANSYVEPFSASIYPSYDADWIKVSINSPNTTLTAEVQDVGNGDCANQVIDSQIEILATDGTTQLAFNDDLSATNYCSKASKAALGIGVYYIKVGSSAQYAPSLTFIYKLKLTLQ
ncbi:MAG: hypothetical protein U0414_13460 [Polyangiaceae bacterium]